MKILKKENYWIWLLLLIFTGGTSTLILGALVDVYDADAWYYRYIKRMSKFGIAILILIVVLFFGSMVLEVLTELKIMSVGFLISFGSLSFIFSFLFLIIGILIIVFNIQILCQTAAKLDIPGKELYLSPYVWIICFIIPIIGWLCIPIMLFYLHIWTIVSLYRGNAEKYIK